MSSGWFIIWMENSRFFTWNITSSICGSQSECRWGRRRRESPKSGCEETADDRRKHRLSRIPEVETIVDELRGIDFHGSTTSAYPGGAIVGMFLSRIFANCEELGWNSAGYKSTISRSYRIDRSTSPQSEKPTSGYERSTFDTSEGEPELHIAYEWDQGTRRVRGHCSYHRRHFTDWIIAPSHEPRGG